MSLSTGRCKNSIKGEAVYADWVNGNDFRNLTAKVLANSDNPIKPWFFKVLVNFMYAALSGGTVLIYVMSQQYNCLMELYTNLMKMYLPSTFIDYCAWVCMHLWLNLINWILCRPTMSMECCSLDCDSLWQHRFWHSSTKEGDIQNLS